MDLLKKVRVNMTVNALLTIAVGLFFITHPYGAGSTIALIAGVAVLIAGIADVVRYAGSGEYGFLMGGSLFGGIIKCVLGLFALTHTDTVISLLSVIFSIFLLLSGLNCLESSRQLKRAAVPGWQVNMTLSAVITAAGVIMLFVPFGAVSTAIAAVGVVLVADGLTELFTMYRMKKIGKEFARRMKDLKDEMDGNIIDM